MIEFTHPKRTIVPLIRKEKEMEVVNSLIDIF